jgi:glycosyltransferase involved in cell wall biosynthesis
MTNISFIGNMGVLHKGNQSTVIRVKNIKNKLVNYGYTCNFFYTLFEDINYISNIIKQSDIIFFHRIQASNKTSIDWKYLYSFLRSKRYGKKIIFDFDDAIFLSFPIITELLILNSDMVFTGSHYLYNYSAKINSNTFLIPSAVDTEIFKLNLNKKRDNTNIVIGWHGSVEVHIKNLLLIVPVINKLSEKYNLTFKLIGTKGSIKLQEHFKSLMPKVNFDFGPNEWVSYEFLPNYLVDIDISLSPLLENRWNRGKCAMKAIESMALGIPVVASDVGEHNYIFKNGHNGFKARNDKEWLNYLELLINKLDLRDKISKKARKFVEKYYSLNTISFKVKKRIESLESS